MEMNHKSEDLQKKVSSLCSLLPVHVEIWNKTLEDLQDPVQALKNFSEQLRFVELADTKYIRNFNNIQTDLQIKILGHIEEELQSIKQHVDLLNKSNQELKNKLSNLERATIDLDWDVEWSIVKGSPIQPPLKNILQMSYKFWVFFSEISKNANIQLKTINVRDEKSVMSLIECFSLHLNKQSEVNTVLAFTQYIIDNKTVK